MRRGATSHDVWSSALERRSFARSAVRANSATLRPIDRRSLPDRLRPSAPSRPRRLPARRNRWRRLGDVDDKWDGCYDRSCVSAPVAVPVIPPLASLTTLAHVHAASPPPARRGVGVTTRSANSATAAISRAEGPSGSRAPPVPRDLRRRDLHVRRRARWPGTARERRDCAACADWDRSCAARARALRRTRSPSPDTPSRRSPRGCAMRAASSHG